MNNLLKRLNNFEEYALTVLLPAMCITIFVATFMRFTNIIVIPWAEELARYMMIWILFFGIGAAAKKGEHFCVMVFAQLFPKSIQKVISVIRMILMIGFMLFVSRFCIIILKNQMMMGQVTPSLFWPMWCVYSGVLVGALIMMIRYVMYGIQELRGNNRQQ